MKQTSRDMGGAPLGNHNALKHGLRSGEVIQAARENQRFYRACRRVLGRIDAGLAQMAQNFRPPAQRLEGLGKPFRH